jgi:excinuclease ABC subunit B
VNLLFDLKAPFTPKGDQIKAIEKLNENIQNGIKEQILLGATGTGKTYTIANIIEKTQKKTLILAPNKTLAGQLYGELKAFFPNNRVEYFISYYDYFQPEAYVVSTDTYIEKDSSINDEIDEMRHSATASLLDSEDVIVVASVSCIYGIGDPEDYKNSMIAVRIGDDYGEID